MFGKTLRSASLLAVGAGLIAAGFITDAVGLLVTGLAIMMIFLVARGMQTETKAMSNVDTVLIVEEGPRTTTTIATFHPESNLLEMHDGYARCLTSALEALHKYQKERNQPVLPVRVEYW